MGVLLTDVKRMVPIWVIVLVTATGVLVALRANGARYLREGTFNSAESCQIAQIHYLSARKDWNALNREVAVEQAAAFGRSSLGQLRSDPELLEAQAKLEEAVDLCPSLPGPNDLLAHLAWWNGDEAMTHYYLGQEHLVQGDTRSAYTELKTAFELRPEDPVISLAAAEAATLHLKWDEAQEIMAKASEEAIETAEGLRIRSRIEAYLGNSDLAYEYAKRSLEKKPGDPMAISQIVAFFQTHEMFESGGDFVMENLMKAEAPAAASYHKAAILYMNGQAYEKALQALDQAIEIEPNIVGLLFDKAICLRRLGRLQAAKNVAQLGMNKDFGEWMKLVDSSGVDPMIEP